MALVASGTLRRRTAIVPDTGRLRRALRKFLDCCKAVICCADWSVPLMLANGANAARVRVCAQGVPMAFAVAAARARADGCATRITDLFTVGYVGRLTPVKGIHLLVEGFRETPYEKARLKIYGWDTDEHVAGYAREVLRAAQSDPRIEFVGKVPLDRMVEEYAGLSLVAVPSVGPETGPMVLYEALALGVPVWGSSRVGQLDVLREKGRVIDPNTAAEWCARLGEAFRLHADGEWQAGSDLRTGLRTMRDVAGEMCAVYDDDEVPPGGHAWRDVR